MKRVKNGKLYDTETARMVGEYIKKGEYEEYELVETLYLKKTGEFFIALSFCGEYSDDNIRLAEWVTNHFIEPMTDPEARKWVEAYCDADTYIAIFGEVEE